MVPLSQLLQLSLGERVILLLRHHWFIFFKKFLIFVIEVLVPVLIYFYLTNYRPEILTNQPLVALLTLAASLYYLFIWTMFFHTWLAYYLDVWVITDKQVIGVKQNGIFNRTVLRHPLYRIQDVMAESQGIFATFLHFGNVKIQTASAEQHLILEAMPESFAAVGQN